MDSLKKACSARGVCSLCSFDHVSEKNETKTVFKKTQKKTACSAVEVADLVHVSCDCHKPALKNALLAKTFHVCSKEFLKRIVVVWDHIYLLLLLFFFITLKPRVE